MIPSKSGGPLVLEILRSIVKRSVGSMGKVKIKAGLEELYQYFSFKGFTQARGSRFNFLLADSQPANTTLIIA
jgi:hypothetical protein